MALFQCLFVNFTRILNELTYRTDVFVKNNFQDENFVTKQCYLNLKLNSQAVGVNFFREFGFQK